MHWLSRSSRRLDADEAAHGLDVLGQVERKGHRPRLALHHTHDLAALFPLVPVAVAAVVHNHSLAPGPLALAQALGGFGVAAHEAFDRALLIIGARRLGDRARDRLAGLEIVGHDRWLRR